MIRRAFTILFSVCLLLPLAGHCGPCLSLGLHGDWNNYTGSNLDLLLQNETQNPSLRANSGNPYSWGWDAVFGGDFPAGYFGFGFLYSQLGPAAMRGVGSNTAGGGGTEFDFMADIYEFHIPFGFRIPKTENLYLAFDTGLGMIIPQGKLDSYTDSKAFSTYNYDMTWGGFMWHLAGGLRYRVSRFFCLQGLGGYRFVNADYPYNESNDQVETAGPNGPALVVDFSGFYAQMGLIVTLGFGD